MTTDQMLLFGLFGLVFALLLWGRWRYDLVAFSALLVGVILGADIGTTVTAQIVAFKLTDYALPAIGVGFFINMFVKRRFWKNMGLFIFGFGILFLGLNIMTSVVKPFGSSETARHFFISFSIYSNSSKDNKTLSFINRKIITIVNFWGEIDEITFSQNKNEAFL